MILNKSYLSAATLLYVIARSTITETSTLYALLITVVTLSGLSGIRK